MSPTQDNIKDVHSLHHQKKMKEENDLVARILRPYSTFLVKYSYLMLVAVLVAVIFCALLGTLDVLGAKPLPNFSEPVKGFEPRGSTIASRKKAFERLEESLDKQLFRNSSKSSLRKKRDATLLQITTNLAYYFDGFIMVYEHENEENLFDHMITICRLHKQKIRNFPQYSYYFQQDSTHHLPNYIAYLNGKSDCEDITKNHTTNFIHLLSSCVEYYTDGNIKKCIDLGECNGITKSICRSHNTKLTTVRDMSRMFNNIFHYLCSADFVVDVNKLKLTSSVDALIFWDTNTQIHFFQPLYDKYLKDLNNAKLNGVQISAYNMFDFKFYLFQSQIVLQSLFIVTAIVLVILFIWFYTGSLFVGLMTIACIIFALVISYFVYGRIFQMPFFPFLNMATLIFIVGIGADDAFVYSGIWEEAKQVYVIKNSADHVEYLIKWTTHALRHALLAMFVTSLTTASAFYANMTSQVTSVKCFGLFAGTAIIVNYLLMVTLFPTLMIIHDRYLSKCMHFCLPNICKTRPEIEEDGRETFKINTSTGGELNNRNDNESQSIIQKLQVMLDIVSAKLFNEYLSTATIKFKYIWIFLLAALGIGGCVVTFSTPGMRPPSTSEFQMFTSSSSLEKFGLEYKKKFAFGAGGQYNLLASVVFGVKPVDNGNKFDPDDNGTLVLHNGALDIASNQIWLFHFCENLNSAPFYIQSRICGSIKSMFTYIQATCPIGQTACCGKSLPLPHDEFMLCFHQTVKLLPGNGVYGPLFDADASLKTLTIDVSTNYHWTMDFDYNEDLFKKTNEWFDVQFKNASTETFKEAWWYIFQDFYDLQTSLFVGTKQSLGIAIAVSFIVILFTSWNLLLSLYSILTITFIISITVGILILSGWRLNIMESVVFSVAAGLSADFTLHYSVAYKTSFLKDNRVERTKTALVHIGPAILMGAFTTFIAGLVMLPSTILAYIQMAQFLMLVMFVSWVYSTFFFLPLCAAIGPTGSTCQLTFSKVKSARQSIHKNNHHIEMEQVENSANPGGVYYGPTE